MSIFIPNRSIKLPKDISVPQSLSPSVFETHRRDQAFQMSKRFDGALVDVVSGVKAASVISEVRYGIVNGVVTAFGVNQPALDDDGLRGCPAFTQYFLNNEVPVTQSITLAAGSYCLWIEGSGSATFNGLTATAGAPKVFTLASGFTGNCVITGTVTKAMINSGLFPAPFSPTQGIIKSFVSEYATATNGTSFDLDNALFTRLKTALRGVASGNNLWNLPVQMYTGWSDDGTNYVSAGGNESFPIASATTFVPAQMIEISFRTGDVASGNLLVYVSGTAYTIAGVTPDTAYTVRAPGDGTNRRIFFTSKIFTGKIIKDSIKIQPVYAQGHLELEFLSNVDSGWLPSGVDIILNILNLSSPSATNPLSFRKNTDNIPTFRLGDGVSVAFVAPVPLSLGQIFKISLDWGTHSTGQKMRITVNGVQSALVIFSGSFGSQDLRFFYGSTVHAGWIVKDSFKIYDRPRW